MPCAPLPPARPRNRQQPRGVPGPLTGLQVAVPLALCTCRGPNGSFASPWGQLGQLLGPGAGAGGGVAGADVNPEGRRRAWGTGGRGLFPAWDVRPPYWEWHLLPPGLLGNGPGVPRVGSTGEVWRTTPVGFGLTSAALACAAAGGRTTPSSEGAWGEAWRARGSPRPWKDKGRVLLPAGRGRRCRVSVAGRGREAGGVRRLKGAGLRGRRGSFASQPRAELGALRPRIATGGA